MCVDRGRFRDRGIQDEGLREEGRFRDRTWQRVCVGGGGSVRAQLILSGLCMQLKI